MQAGARTRLHAAQGSERRSHANAPPPAVSSVRPCTVADIAPMSARVKCRCLRCFRLPPNKWPLSC